MSDSPKNIVVIGGGIIGSSTAYFLTRHPSYNPSKHTITLLEATSIAAGASGKAGGLLALWAYPSCLVPLSYRLHKSLADEHGGSSRWGYRAVNVGQIDLKGRHITAPHAQASSNGAGKGEGVQGLHGPDVSTDGNVSLKKRSKESYSNLRGMGVPEDLDWVADESVQGYESMGSTKNTAQVHPYQFTTSMAALAAEKGVNVVMGSCTEITTAKGGVEKVKYTDKETGEEKTIDATDVVVTAGPWSGTVWPGAPIGALRAHSVTIRPTREVSGYALFTQIALPKNYKEGVKSKAMHVTPEIYARPNNELYACGEGDNMVPLPKTAADVVVDEGRCQDIVDYCASFSDEMRDGEVLVRQACYLPQVETGGGPLVGPTNTKGVYIATGHTCWGIQNGPGTGKLVSEFVFDGKASSANVSSLDPRRVLRR